MRGRLSPAVSLWELEPFRGAGEGGYSAVTVALGSHLMDTYSSSPPDGELRTGQGTSSLGCSWLEVSPPRFFFFFEQEVETSERFRTCSCTLCGRCHFEFIFKKCCHRPFRL